MKVWIACGIAALALGGLAAVARAEAPRYVPERTVVAILPVANISGEKDASQKAKQTESAQAELEKRWRERGFRIADPAVVSKALADMKVDLNDEEQYRKAVFAQVGKAAGAQLVMFMAITDVSQRLSENVFSKTKEGKAKSRAWLMDAVTGDPIFANQICEGKSTGGHFGELEKGSRRIELAAANGVRDQLKSFFAAYPLVKQDKKR